MSSPYFDFAHIYDACMDELPYEDWSRFVKRTLDSDRIGAGELVLDLGCGTGTLTLLLRDLGYDMIGVDLSESMLEEARDKYYECLDVEEENGEPKLPILFLQQDMRAFELYGTVRAVVSFGDTMNYAGDIDELTGIFRLVNNYLDPGGLFIFDLKTLHYYRDVAATRTYTDVREDMALIWDNEFDAATNKNTYRLTMFLSEDEETYVRREETHVQTAFSVEEIRQAIKESGLVLEHVYEMDDDGTEREATDTAERLFFVCREQMKKAGSMQKED
ncbi:MAG: class I SAM-dependent methyltransferase [Lachnospiraceae bacterium]|nr:class I SAM-dependent methyltransferase [Lachnospiraceae bacterium]